MPMKCLPKKQVRILARSPCNDPEIGTVLARLWIKIMVRGSKDVRKYFRINSASHVGA